jgi:hypothetical protein
MPASEPITDLAAQRTRLAATEIAAESFWHVSSSRDRSAIPTNVYLHGRATVIQAAPSTAQRMSSLDSRDCSHMRRQRPNPTLDFHNYSSTRRHDVLPLWHCRRVVAQTKYCRPLGVCAGRPVDRACTLPLTTRLITNHDARANAVVAPLSCVSSASADSVTELDYLGMRPVRRAGCCISRVSPSETQIPVRACCCLLAVFQPCSTLLHSEFVGWLFSQG